MIDDPRPPPLLDWHDRSHWAWTEAPCRHCREPTHLRDDNKQPSHKVCAEQDAAARDLRAARNYHDRF